MFHFTHCVIEPKVKRGWDQMVIYESISILGSEKKFAYSNNRLDKRLSITLKNDPITTGCGPEISRFNFGLTYRDY